jgi:hypothetical protein
MWKRLREPLSARQMAGATALVLLAMAAVYGLYSAVAWGWHRHVVESSIPGALAGMRTQREELVKVIESYKSAFGYYPPMFTPGGPGRGVFNPLCYELLGVRFDPRTKEFHIPITKDGLSISEVQKYFNTQWFSNCLSFPTTPTNFLANRALAVTPLSNDADIFGVSLSYTDFTPESCWTDFDFTPWRYTTNPAQHNPGRFDLWVEVNVVGKHFTIGNWPEVQ